jgi:hypothetical protein
MGMHARSSAAGSRQLDSLGAELSPAPDVPAKCKDVYQEFLTTSPWVLTLKPAGRDGGRKSMVNASGIGMLAIGLGIGAAVAYAPVASADSSSDLLSSIDSLLRGGGFAAASTPDLTPDASERRRQFTESWVRYGSGGVTG